MNFVRLDRFATQYDQVLIHPKDWEEVLLPAYGKAHLPRI